MIRISHFLLPSLKYKIQKEDISVVGICSKDLTYQKKKKGTYATIGGGEHLTRIRLGGDTLDEKTDKLYHQILKEEDREKTKKKILNLRKGK